MATPVFCFKAPCNIGQPLYFIQNTFFELPETIPMDLSSFVYYHLSTGRSLEGFITNWQKINTDGSSLQGCTYEGFMSTDEKNFHIEESRITGAVDRALDLSNLTDELTELLDNSCLSTKGLCEVFHNTNYLVYLLPKEYYYSRHFLCSMIYSDLNVYLDVYKDPNAISFIYKNRPFPLEYVPHKYRSFGYFKDECMNLKQEWLIPRVEGSVELSYGFDGSYVQICEILSKWGDLFYYLNHRWKNNSELFQIALKSSKNPCDSILNVVSDDLRKSDLFKSWLLKMGCNNDERDASLPF